VLKKRNAKALQKRIKEACAKQMKKAVIKRLTGNENQWDGIDNYSTTDTNGNTFIERRPQLVKQKCNDRFKEWLSNHP
jgi:hypothetical protein